MGHRHTPQNSHTPRYHSVGMYNSAFQSTRCLCNCKNFAGLAALAEVCAVLSAIFLPRDAMRSLLSPGVRLCVRPSFTLVHGIQTAGDMVKLLSRPGSPIILVFLTRVPVPNSKGNPFNRRGANTRGWENFAIFD